MGIDSCGADASGAGGVARPVGNGVTGGVTGGWEAWWAGVSAGWWLTASVQHAGKHDPRQATSADRPGPPRTCRSCGRQAGAGPDIDLQARDPFRPQACLRCPRAGFQDCKMAESLRISPAGACRGEGWRRAAATCPGFVCRSAPGRRPRPRGRELLRARGRHHHRRRDYGHSGRGIRRQWRRARRGRQAAGTEGVAVDGATGRGDAWGAGGVGADHVEI